MLAIILFSVLISCLLVLRNHLLHATLSQEMQENCSQKTESP